MQNQIFIRSPPAKSALQKIFLLCKIKMKNCNSNIEAASKGSSLKTNIHKTNNRISKTLQKDPQRSPPSPKRQTHRLQLHWKWAHPSIIPQAYPKSITITRKTLEWLPPEILFTIKVKGRLLGRMTWQFLNVLELFSPEKRKLSNFHFRSIFIFNKKEPQSCQFATYWQKAVFEFLTSQTG